MPRRVLVVEDDPGVLRSLTRNLLARGFEVSGAGTAADALARLGGADAVVLDLALPGAPGTDVLEAIHDEGLGVPVALWTGHADAPLVREALALRPDAVFRKTDVEKLIDWLGDPHAA